MRYILDVVFLEEFKGDLPRARADHFVDPFAMLQNFYSLKFVHYNFALLFNSLLVARNTYNQVDMFKQFLGLFKHLRMADVIHIKHTICVNAHGVIGVVAFRYVRLLLTNKLGRLISSLQGDFLGISWRK